MTVTKGLQKRLDVFCAFREMLITGKCYFREIAMRWEKFKSKNTGLG